MTRTKPGRGLGANHRKCGAQRLTHRHVLKGPVVEQWHRWPMRSDRTKVRRSAVLGRLAVVLTGLLLAALRFLPRAIEWGSAGHPSAPLIRATQSVGPDPV
jgi:hypothetical protein